MSDKRYHVVFSGKLVPGKNPSTVQSNLVLDIGMSEEKAELLLSGQRKVLKRLPTISEAQRLAEKLERAGIICVIEDHAVDGRAAAEQGSGESSLITLINRFKPVSRKKRESDSKQQAL